MDKREFIKGSVYCMSGLFCAKLFSNEWLGSDDRLWKWSREAIFYEVTPRGVKCGICPKIVHLKSLSACLT